MTGTSLTRERNIFLGGLLGLAALTFIFNITVLSGVSVADPATLDGVAVAGTLISKAAAVYFVFRLSRFLRQRVWLTVVYCILTPFSIVYLIPFIGLLVGVGRARRDLAAGENTESSSVPERM